MSEVSYWAEKLKTRWIEEKTGGGDATDTQAEGEGEECLRALERHLEIEEKETGEHTDSCSQFLK